jgi:hypothetical protein
MLTAGNNAVEIHIQLVSQTKKEQKERNKRQLHELDLKDSSFLPFNFTEQVPY